MGSQPKSSERQSGTLGHLSVSAQIRVQLLRGKRPPAETVARLEIDSTDLDDGKVIILDQGFRGTAYRVVIYRPETEEFEAVEGPALTDNDLAAYADVFATLMRWKKQQERAEGGGEG